MNNIFIISAFISIIFFVIKFIEMRIVDKDCKPLKSLIRDPLLVYFSVIAGYFIVDQIDPIIFNGGAKIGASKMTPTVFTDNPDF
jgi:hypothetical protein